MALRNSTAITTTTTTTTSSSNTTISNTHSQCSLEPLEVVLVVLACAITFIVFFFNGYILWKVTFMRWKRNKARGNYDLLLSYLSMFDLLSAITMSARIYNEATRCSSTYSWPLGQIGCKLVLPLYDISINMSVCILIIISIDRCQSVLTPLKRTFKRKRIHASVLLSIVLSVGLYFERFITAEVHRGTCEHYLVDPMLSLSPLLVWVLRDLAFLVIFTITSVCIQRSLRGTSFVTKYHKNRSNSISRILIFTQLVFSALVLPYDILSSISLGYGIFVRSSKIAGLRPYVSNPSYIV